MKEFFKELDDIVDNGMLSINDKRVDDKDIINSYPKDMINRVRRNMNRSSYGIMFEPVDKIEVYKDKDKDEAEIIDINKAVTNSIDLVFLVSELIALKGSEIVYKDLLILKDKYEGEDND